MLNNTAISTLVGVSQAEMIRTAPKAVIYNYESVSTTTDIFETKLN